MSNVVVIVPVYDGLDETVRCLESLIASVPLAREKFGIMVINDASPNPALVEYLEGYAKNTGVQYLVNETNKGFVGTVNRGMREAGDADVVLLNSDTEVANDWLDRIKECAYSSADIGTVTPYCNNAEICSFPVFVKSNELPDGETTKTLDELFARIGIREVIDLPTAVGFCMYIKRICLDRTGYFDEETFGRGYGEENDFCMRAMQRGFRHVLCQNVFVFHEGGVSFGPEKLKRVQRAMDTLDRLYPDYHEMVHQFVQSDPPRASRLRLFLEYLRNSRRNKHKVLAITHNLGGGTERHIKELARYLSKKAVFLVLRAGQGGRFSLSFGSDDSSPSMILSLPDDYQFLLAICKYVGVSRIHCHHIMGVEPSVWGLLGDLGVRMDVTLHDYYFINANPTLTDPDGEFCQDRLTRDAHCAKRYQLPGQASPEFWRYNQYNFLKQADRIFSPCEYTAKLYKEYFPEISILPVYHPDWEESPQYPPVSWPEIKPGKPLRIAVLGAISKEKGADILDATARLALRGDEVEFHLIGYAYRPLEPSIHETGPYKEEELDALIREANPHLIWFPCRWPETYSYTLSAALKAGLPVAAPDLGSFPERLHGRSASWVGSWKSTPGEWLDFFARARSFLQSERGALRQTPLITAPSAFRYQSNYLLGSPNEMHGEAVIDWGVFSIKASAQTAMMSSADLGRPLSEDELLLVWLLKIRSKPAVYLFLKLLPFNLMQMFKRNLTERPIHEVMTRYQLHGGDLGLSRTVLPGIFRAIFRGRSAN